MKENKELSDELDVLKVMATENPCGMQAELLSSIAHSIKGLFSVYIVNGVSREYVSRYLGVSTRTVTRWRNEYPDFPKPRHNGHMEISYSWEEVIRWKLKHKDLFEKKAER